VDIMETKKELNIVVQKIHIIFYDLTGFVNSYVENLVGKREDMSNK